MLTSAQSKHEPAMVKRVFSHNLDYQRQGRASFRRWVTSCPLRFVGASAAGA